VIWLLAAAAVAQSEAVVEPPAPPDGGEQIWIASTFDELRALDKVVRQAVALGARVEPVGVGRRCLVFDADVTLDPRWTDKVERRLGEPLRERLSCAVARYPVGRGWLVAELEPDPDLERRAGDVVEPLAMSVLSQPLDGRPASLCVSKMQVAPDALKSDLEATGLVVRGIYEVGGCVAERSLPAAKGW